MKELYYLLMAASLLALLVNRRRLDRRLFLFAPLLLLALLSDGSADIFGNEHWLHNFIFTIYTPVEYGLLSIITASFLQNEAWKKAIYYSIPVFAIASIGIQVWLKPLGSFYTYLDASIGAPLLCLWTLLFFVELSADRNITPFVRNPLFWIATGNLLFYSVSAFSYSFRGYLKENGSADYVEILDWVTRMGNLLLYFFYLIAFSLPWATRKYS
jgi:hypothetical protein